MTKRLKQAALVLIGLLAVAQFIRPDRTNPPIDATRTIAASAGTPSQLAAVLDRSCRDCHSDRTVWPWYTRVAPVSWVMAYGVNKGRDVINFSEWAAYSPEKQRALLTASCTDVKAGKMPGVYTLIDRSTRLSAEDVETVCAAARQAERRASNNR